MYSSRGFALCLSLLVSASAITVENNAGVTPVQKVIQMMEGMVAKGKKEKHDEQVQYAAYKQFCDNTQAQKTQAIEDAAEQIEVLKADIAMFSAEAAKLAKEIKVNEQDINVWAADLKAATKVRKFDKEDYDADRKETELTIEETHLALKTMKGAAHNTGFLQLKSVRNNVASPNLKNAIDAFLEEDDSEGAPEAHSYEHHGGQLVEMLESTLAKAEEQLSDLEASETASINEYEMLVSRLQTQTQHTTSDMNARTEAKADNLEKKAQREGELTDTTNMRAADTKYLQDLTSECQQKAEAFEARQQLRAEELEAINKAIEIVGSGAVSGAADKHLPALIQQSKGTALAVRGANTNSAMRARVSSYLRQQGKKLGSKTLVLLAETAEDDPFAKIKKMIGDLIYKLMEEAQEEATQKGWCDTELATNEKTRNEKTDMVEKLNAKIDELEASIAKLKGEVSELQAALSELASAMEEATSLREKEKAKNEDTIADATGAQAAVAQAIDVLKDFYDKASQATAFVQSKKQEPPAVFDDTPYTGMGGGGVLGMMEVMQSDFARLEAETKSAEASGAAEYKSFMQDSEIDKEAKETDAEHKETMITEQKHALHVAKDDALPSTQEELDAALHYYDKLKPQCVDTGVSYEDRVARRKEEIDSLKEALKILSGEDIA